MTHYDIQLDVNTSCDLNVDNNSSNTIRRMHLPIMQQGGRVGAWPLWSMRPVGRWSARLHLAGHRRWLAAPRSGERAARVARAAHAALHFALARPAAAVASRLQPCGVAGLSPALSRAVARDGGCSETGSQAVHRFRAQKLRCVHQRACYPRGRPSACSRRRALLPVWLLPASRAAALEMTAALQVGAVPR